MLDFEAGSNLDQPQAASVHQRSRLERLCRCITHPLIAAKRLSVDGRGRVVYQYKPPFRGGSTQVVLEPPPNYELSQFRFWPLIAIGTDHVLP